MMTPPMTLLRGDNRSTLIHVADATVHTVVTSPPYYAVRDYETPPVGFEPVEFLPAIGLPPLQLKAWEGQMGLEPDPWLFIGHLLLTFRAVRRVLRPDGTLWVNLGDTYYTGAGPAGENPGGGRRGERAKAAFDHAPKGRGTHGDSPKHAAGATVTRYTTPNRMPIPGWKPKDLMGIPWMFARAMQADGWTLRSDIVWHKPNPMPGSQKDRPTTSHEYVFLFSKSEGYFYDNEAIKEPVDATSSSEYVQTPTGWNTGEGNHRSLKGRHRPTKERGEFNGKTEAMADTGRNAFRATRTTREKRDVWTVTSRPYKGAHFATFPPDLVRPCLLAGTSAKGACPDCGAPWRRLVELVKKPVDPVTRQDAFFLHPPQAVEGSAKEYVIESVTRGWRPTCICGSDPALKMQPDDLQEMETPTGDQVGECEALQKGRANGKKPSEESGKRLITLYEHRRYAEQIRALGQDHRRLMQDDCEGDRQFEHYTRTDRFGARPIPPELLERWTAAGWLRPVAVPEWNYPTPVPCVVLDPFAGSGTVGEVALEEGRHVILCELAPHYEPLIRQRTNVTPPLFTT